LILFVGNLTDYRETKVQMALLRPFASFSGGRKDGVIRRRTRTCYLTAT
jgi:hypothetical protein